MSHLTNTELPMSQVPGRHAQNDSLTDIIQEFRDLEAYKNDQESLIELVLVDKFNEGGIVVRKPGDFDLWLVEWDLVDVYNGKVPAMIRRVAQLAKGEGVVRWAARQAPKFYSGG